jgi:hypothetical protein
MPGLRARDDLVDVALQDSFPASDPPAFVAGGVAIGGPFRRETFYGFGSADARSDSGVGIRMQRLRPKRARKVPGRPTSEQLTEKGAGG